MFAGFYDTPLTYANTKRAAHELKRRYPFLDVYTIGTSVLGREIFAFSLGRRQNCALYVGAVHGMEWLTGLLLFRFLEDACGSVEQGSPLGELDLSRVLEQRSVTIIPLLNPDGVEIAVAGSASAGVYADIAAAFCGEIYPCRWQANARGVDLNHNFDAGFQILKKMEQQAGYTAAGPTRYGGPYPHSEPETAALVNFCERYTPRLSYAFHSQGEEIYYDYPPYTPKESYVFACVLAKLSGYRVCDPDVLASHGGFKDWFLCRFRKPAFTLEIGRGRNPLPIAELCPIYARLLEVLLVGILL